MSGKKRKRDASSHDWWECVAAWVRQHGGIVHPAITCDTTKNDRQLRVTEPIPKGTVLMEIPKACLVSCDNLKCSPVGRKVGECLESIKLENQAQDVWIAFALALQLECDKPPDIGFDYRPYLGTLPPFETFDSLPRRWSEDDKKLLQGSGLLRRVEEAAAGITKDYHSIATVWTGAPPSLQSFDALMAAVTSRAFAGMGETCLDRDIAFVPILDLCNHHRGDHKKNVSYERLYHSGKVQARAQESLNADSVLKITYGAKGNQQLLLNYGFTIPGNIEADGSSNDDMEVLLHPNGPPVKIRTGPKSYTFGCLSRAVEQFHKQDTNSAIQAIGPQVDLEAFLDECEQEGPGTCGLVIEEDDNEQDDEDEELDLDAELGAIRNLFAALVKMRSSYYLKGDFINNHDVDSRKRYYAEVLIHSEIRTLQFYELVCLRLVKKFSRSDSKISFKWVIKLDTEDESRLYQQAEDLVDAFVGIRGLDTM